MFGIRMNKHFTELEACEKSCHFLGVTRQHFPAYLQKLAGYPCIFFLKGVLRFLSDHVSHSHGVVESRRAQRQDPWAQ